MRSVGGGIPPRNGPGPVTTDISDWLADELKQRAWSSSELARQADISQSSVSNVLLRKQIPGLEFCKAVAQALDTPVTDVLRMAGHLPPVPPPVYEEQEAMRLLRALNRQMRDVALSILRALYASTQQSDPGAGSVDSFSERLAREIAYDLGTMAPDDQRRVIDLMKRLRGDRGAEEADHVSLGADL
jgi:transcriptional regulator with XRE-family HTH domain